MSHIFQTGGALLADSAVYIERKADTEAIAHLRQMDYLLVIESRQQGKTSLLARLCTKLESSRYVFAYVDVEDLNYESEQAWFADLWGELSWGMGSALLDAIPSPPVNCQGWREQVRSLAQFAHKRSFQVIIALDEVGSMSKAPWAEQFFAGLRKFYNQRAFLPFCQKLTFILSGAFHPRDLISDDKISPFNVAQRVRLLDFTAEQVRELVGKGNWSEEQATALAERIHYWTDGQPYLAQLLCSYLGPDATPADVDANVERLRREDENHLPPILEQLNRDEKLRWYVGRVVTGKRIKFYPREHRRQAQLELLGAIKADAEGYCIVRNRIYVRALAHDVPLSKVPQILLDFTSAQSLVEEDWEPYGSEARDVQLTLEYDITLGKRMLVKKGRGFDAAVRYKPPNASPLKWECSHYELLVQMHPESIICIRVLDETGKERTLLYSSAILSGLNHWEEFHIPLGKDASDGTWHSLLIDLPEHMEQAHWPGFVMVNWFSLRGEMALAGIRGCADEDSLRKSAMACPHPVHFTLAANNTPKPGVDIISQEPKPMPFSELAEALQRCTLTLFIGADLPRAVTGLPSRANLARELARRHGLDESLSLAEVAQRVSQAGNRWAFTAFIRDALDTAGKPPQPFHRRIVAMVQEHQIETIITTAYDNLLESAFQEAGIGLNRVVRGSDVHFIRPSHPTLIKLYGDAQQPDTLVVTDRDHSDLLRDRDREPLIDEVRRAFRRNTVLFLGYNLSDPDFRFLFDQIAQSRFARTAYAVWPGLPEADVRMWRDRGIVILDADPLGVLDTLPETPAAQGVASPEIPVANSEISSELGGEMDYERGLGAFKRLAEGTDWHQDFTVHEAALRENLRDERRYGPSEQTRRDRTRIVDQLNALALEHLGLSFNDLCLGKQPPPGPSASTKGNGEPTGPEPVYGAGNRWAVLVGVNEYEDRANYGRLQVCVKDVHAIREQLIAGGFDPARIRLLTDDIPDDLPTRANILTALKSVADATEPDDLLLFYYSGHGDERESESYLVARDGRFLVLGDTAVPVSRIKEIVEQAPARAKVIVLDACHSGADIGGKGPRPMAEGFIRRVFEQAEGLAILASCKQGQLSYEWRAQERSVFTHFLLEALAGQADRDEKGFVTVQDASRHVTDGVKLWASQRDRSQTPTLQAAVAGDIILVRYA